VILRYVKSVCQSWLMAVVLSLNSSAALTGTVAARWWVAQRDVSRLELDGPVGGDVRFLSAARF
jgi:hypothetical protein